MAISRDDRERERIAGPKFTRVVVLVFASAALVGLAIGIGWVIAALLNFQRL